jgi:hypothetical protein
MEVSKATCKVTVARFRGDDVLVFDGPSGLVILGEDASYDEILLAVEKTSGRKVCGER